MQDLGLVYPQGFHILIALPCTSNRNCALSAGLRLSGGGRGFVRGLSAVDKIISGSCLLTSDARSSPSPGILYFALDDLWYCEPLMVYNWVVEHCA